MNCRGLPDKRRDEEALQTKKTKRRETPRLTSYFPEEYTMYPLATLQPKSAKLHNNPKERIWKKHLISKKN